jgi:hypothetical protein
MVFSGEIGRDVVAGTDISAFPSIFCNAFAMEAVVIPRFLAISAAVRPNSVTAR